MAKLFYGIIIPTKDFLDIILKTKVKVSKGENLYKKYAQYLQEEYGDVIDEDNEEELEEDPYEFLINSVDFFQRIDIPDPQNFPGYDLLDNNEHVFIGENFTPAREDSLLPPSKQVPSHIKNEVENTIRKYKFDGIPEVLILGDRNISESTEFDEPSLERLS